MKTYIKTELEDFCPNESSDAVLHFGGVADLDMTTPLKIDEKYCNKKDIARYFHLCITNNVLDNTIEIPIIDLKPRKDIETPPHPLTIHYNYEKNQIVKRADNSTLQNRNVINVLLNAGRLYVTDGTHMRGTYGVTPQNPVHRDYLYWSGLLYVDDLAPCEFQINLRAAPDVHHATDNIYNSLVFNPKEYDARWIKILRNRNNSLSEFA